jgi:hypothetical protein
MIDRFAGNKKDKLKGYVLKEPIVLHPSLFETTLQRKKRM